MQQPEKIKVIISGGGTGGHIFPAIAIADTIKKMVPGAEFLFVGAIGRMEMEKVPAAGYLIEGLWISGFQRKPSVENLLFPFKVISSLLKARRIIKSFKPDVVIGTGGYASGPTVRAAASLKIPTLIQEQNSYPGITNRMLAKKAKVICVAFEGMEKYFPQHKIILTGNPVREEIINNTITRNEALSFFGLKDDRITLLVIGGSLGAKTINNSIHSGLKLLAENKIQVIWQSGKLYARTAELVASHYCNDGILTMPFIKRMDMAYAAADIVISRAGALALSELCIKAKPSILIPSPNVAEDHQTKNTMALKRRNAVILVRDQDARRSLVKKVLELAKDEQLRAELKENIEKLAYPFAAQDIANAAIKLATTKKGQSRK